MDKVIFRALLPVLLLAATALPARADSSSERDIDPFRIVNVKIEPLALLYGIFGGEVNFRLADRWALGGALTWFEYSTSGRILTARQYGLSASYYLNGRSGDGVYLRPIAQILPITIQDRTGLTGTTTVSNDLLGMIVG